MPRALYASQMFSQMQEGRRKGGQWNFQRVLVTVGPGVLSQILLVRQGQAVAGAGCPVC